MAGDFENLWREGREPAPLYRTDLGAAYVGDALELLRGLRDGSVDLVLTSSSYLMLSLRYLL